jgi:hypothetical protein
MHDAWTTHLIFLSVSSLIAQITKPIVIKLSSVSCPSASVQIVSLGPRSLSSPIHVLSWRWNNTFHLHTYRYILFISTVTFIIADENEQIVNIVVASIPLTQSLPNYPLNLCLILMWYDFVINYSHLSTIRKNFLAISAPWHLLAFRSRDMKTAYTSVFSAFTSEPVYLLVSDTASLLFFMVDIYVLGQETANISINQKQIVTSIVI